MLSIFRVFILIFLFSISSSSFAQERLSLQDAVGRVLENNLDIKVLKVQEQIAVNNNTKGLAGAYPSVSAYLFPTLRYDAYLDDPNDDQGTVSISPGVEASWVLFDGFKVDINKNRYQLLQQLSEGNTALLIENLVQATVAGYYTAVLEQNRKEALTESLILSTDRYDYEKTKKDLGVGSTFDLLQAENAILTDSSAIVNQNINIRNAIRQLNLLMNEDVNKDWKLEDEILKKVDSDYAFDFLSDELKLNNRQLYNQFLNSELSKNSTEFAESNVYPRASVTAGTGYNFRNLALYQNPTQNVSTNNLNFYSNFSVNFNLFNGGKTRVAIQNAKLQEDISALNYDKMLIELNSDLDENLDTYYDNLERYNLSVRLLESARLNMQIAEERFKNGIITSFDFRNVQLAFLNAAFNEINTRYFLKLIELDLIRLSGGMLEGYE